MLLNVVSYVADLRNIDDIGVFLAEVALFADNELALIVVNMYLCASAKASCNVEAVKILSVLLAVLDLRLDFADGRFFSIGKEGRKLLFAVGANVAVLKLAECKHADLATADIAEFLFKKSHGKVSFSNLFIRFYYTILY